MLRNLLETVGNQLTDRIAHGGEFLLVFGHDVALVQNRIMMQIPGGGFQLPDVRVFNLF